MAPVLRLARLVELLGQAEVGDLGRAVLGQQHVGRLQVAVDDALARGPPAWPAPASRPAGAASRGGSGVPPSFFVQAAAGAELQREERQAVVLADLVDLHDVGMLQAGDGLGLGAEAGQFRAAGVAAGQDHLQGDQRGSASSCRAL